MNLPNDNVDGGYKILSASVDGYQNNEVEDDSDDANSRLKFPKVREDSHGRTETFKIFFREMSLYFNSFMFP